MQINGIILNCTLEDVLDELRKQLQLRHINYLTKIKNSSGDIMVTCPYHSNGQEKRPSAGIRKSDGQFHCFACGEVHSLSEVISYCFGYTDDIIGKFGWQWLIRNFGTASIEERKDVKLDFNRNTSNRKFTGNQFSKNSNNYITEEELERYRYIHPYMYKRKLTDEIIELFDIGYDKNTESITFPVKDINGNTLFVARRSVNTKFFNYPPFAIKPLYGLYELSITHKLTKDTELIVCESMLDALTCWVYGKPAVALNGLGDEYQFEQLRKLPCRKLILATDNDDAGMSARTKIKAAVRNKLITEYLLPTGKKDINELSKEEFDNLKEVY